MKVFELIELMMSNYRPAVICLDRIRLGSGGNDGPSGCVDLIDEIISTTQQVVVQVPKTAKFYDHEEFTCWKTSKDDVRLELFVENDKSL